MMMAISPDGVLIIGIVLGLIVGLIVGLLVAVFKRSSQ